MVVLSVMRAPARQAASRALLSLKSPISPLGGTRMGGHGRMMIIRPSQYYLRVMKDMCHFYFLLGAIPYSLIIIYCNMFIGPATLSEIPEGYIPRHWEYERHPITRWWAWLLGDWSINYAMTVQTWQMDGEQYLIVNAADLCRSTMKVHQDYKSWFYTPVYAKNHRYIRSRYQDWNLEKFGEDTFIREKGWGFIGEPDPVPVEKDPYPVR